MATFEAQVEALTTLAIDSSGTNPTQAQLTQFLTDGAREVIGALPADLLHYCTGSTRIKSSTAEHAISSDTDMGKILYVTRYDGSRERPCRLIAASKKGLASDSTDIANYSPSSDPAYCITGKSSVDSTSTQQTSIVTIIPSPTDSQYGVVYHVSYPAVAFGDDSISNFPDTAEYIVVLYASLKSILAKVGGLTIVPNVSGDASTLTSDSQAITSGQIGTDAEFLEFDMWFTALGEMIEDDEDIELASAQIEKINTYVNTWNIQLQGNIAEMQRYLGIYSSLRADYVQGLTLLKGAVEASQQRRG